MSTPNKYGIHGHSPLGIRVNIKKELRRIRDNPLTPLLETLGYDGITIVSDSRSRFADAYWFYYLSIARFLPGMSLTCRWHRGPKWKRRARRAYTDADRRVADGYNRVAPFLELDLVNCLIHARILMDRLIGLSSEFLPKGINPSFASFNDHKKWFIKRPADHGVAQEYADRIRLHTEWFDMPLKAVRDNYVVHVAPKHMRFLGIPNGNFELDLTVIVAEGKSPLKPMERQTVIQVNVLRLVRDVEELLRWYNDFALKTLSASRPVVP